VTLNICKGLYSKEHKIKELSQNFDVILLQKVDVENFDPGRYAFNGYNVYAKAGYTQTRVLILVRHGSYKLVTQRFDCTDDRQEIWLELVEHEGRKITLINY
jgi:hypothetical protein